MADSEKHLVRFWRGTRESYNYLATNNALDYWTRYSVKEPSGVWSEYFGDNLISNVSGQLLPVIDIVQNLPTELNNGDRYLVGHDAPEGQTTGADYYIVEAGTEKSGDGFVQNTVVKPFNEKYSVRVKSKGYMSYQLVNGVLTTYDEVDCGTY